MSKPENELSGQLVDYLIGHGHWAFKVHGGPFQRSGIPDVLGFRKGDGMGFAIEVKIDEEVTKLQDETLGEIASSGALAIVLHGKRGEFREACESAERYVSIGPIEKKVCVIIT